MAPHSCIVVGLKFETDAYLVGLRLRKLRHCGVRLIEGAEKVLHMMAHLMRYYIGIAEIARRSYLALHCLEEVKIDIDSLVGRAIERSGLSRTLSASCLYRSAVDHHLRRRIFAPTLLAEDFGPDILRSGEHLRRKIVEPLVFGIKLNGLLRLSASALLHGAEDRLRHITDTAARHKRQDSRNYHSDDTATDTDRLSRHTATVLDVAALSSSVKSHFCIL